MRIISGQDINTLYLNGLDVLEDYGEVQQSRNGRVIVYPHGPIITEWTDPTQRVLFCPVRDANPFFHFMEAMWMLAGRNDVAFLKQFNSSIDQFSDDGETLRGAYGYRWRHWFGRDYLTRCIDKLQSNPLDRRVVLPIWDGDNDGKADSKDIPCNTHIYFRIQRGELITTVCNRSNDIIWGLYGANAVHMSYLHEFVSLATGCTGPGKLVTLSNNFHAYPELYPLHRYMEESLSQEEYTTEGLRTYPIMGETEVYVNTLTSIENFCENPQYGLMSSSPFIQDVAYPIYKAWDTRSLAACREIKAEDWALACYNWIYRRSEACTNKSDLVTL